MYNNNLVFMDLISRSRFVLKRCNYVLTYLYRLYYRRSVAPCLSKNEHKIRTYISVIYIYIYIYINIFIY